MKRKARALVLTVLLALTGVAADDVTAVTRLTPADVAGSWALNIPAGFTGTSLQLKDGVYWYWYYSDVTGPDDKLIRFPISGKYSIEGNRLVLEPAPGVRETQWVYGDLRGIRGLFSVYKLEAARRRKEPIEVAMLIRVSLAVDLEHPVQNSLPNPYALLRREPPKSAPRNE